MEKDFETNFNNFENITDEFKSATSNLYLGELVCYDKFFSLFEAMSAIEIMDPKMDAGMIFNKKKKILSFKKSIEAGLVKVNDFTFEEKIGIVDETYACLATWLEGNSLVQTVFTNLYLHDPSLIKDRFMRTFSYVILKLVDFIKNLITIANVAEDEDLHSNYSLFKCNLIDSKVSSMIKDLEDDLFRKFKGLNKYKDENCKNNVNEISKTTSNLNNDSNGKNNLEKKLLDYKYYSALYTRIKITRSFYQFFLILNRQFLETNNLNGKKDLNNLLIDNVFSELIKKMEICESNIDNWISTINLGKKPKEEIISENECISDYPTIMGFSPLINLRLLPPIFPKYAKIKTRENSLLFLKNLFFHLKNIFQIRKYETFKDCLLFCDQLSKNFYFQSCICSRSTLNVINTFQPNFNLDINKFSSILKHDIYQMVKPIVFKKKNLSADNLIQEYLDMFFMRCYAPMSKLMHATCLNRAKQRGKLESILPELSGLYTYAERLDTFFSVKFNLQNLKHDYFSLWLSYYIFRVMIQYLLLGFELELFSQHEYSYIYWYLSNNLINKMTNVLLRIDSTSMIDDQTDNKQKNKNLNKIKHDKERSNDLLVDEFFIYNGIKFLTDGLHRVCKVMIDKNLIAQPKIIAENQYILYYHRLAPFLDLSFPLFVDYEKYKQDLKIQIESFENSNAILIVADSAFDKAKKLFLSVCNSNKEVDSLIKIAKTNSVVLKLIYNGHKKLENLKLDFIENKNFPIFKLV